MIKIDEEYIKSLPLVTNKVNVTWEREKFFFQYNIVSYYSTNKEHNLPYEQLADLPCLSVTGIRARWNNKPTVKFFILVDKGNENIILQSLRNYDDIAVRIDDLQDYDEKTNQRIIASLAINSLGKKRNNTRIYHDGALLICDDQNFGAKSSRKELVCLRIEVNEYLILTAKTNSFSHPRTDRDLLKHKNCVFQVCKNIDGILWAGQSVKPVVIGDIKSKKFNLEEYYIKRKRFLDNKNLVPYWPYGKENYTHGRLFAISQVLENTNELFAPIINIQFAKSQVLHYDACKTGDSTLGFIKDGLKGTSLYIDNPFKTAASAEMSQSLISKIKQIVGEGIDVHKKQQSGDMVIKLCEPNNDEANVHYEQSLTRLMRSDSVLQHYIYDENAKDNSVTKSTARRILIELLIKHGLLKEIMPQELAKLIEGWSFTRYKLVEGGVHGATLSVDHNKIHIREHGLASNLLGEDYVSFCAEKLHFNESDLIKGSRDYMAMEKDGNVYLIIDTDEIPILDTKLIDEGYGKIFNEGETISMFKRKGVAHDYLRGYIGFHLWKTEGLHGEPEGSYSYIAGTNSESMQILPSARMDKMPRARRIFILNALHPTTIESEIYEISSMLKYGFGRWNEIMTYPFPFKYLYEYLDNVSETIFYKHWKEV